VSLDGAADVNDTQRPMRNGRPGGWALATARVSGLLADPGQAKLAARATVTRHDMDVSARLRAISAILDGEIPSGCPSRVRSRPVDYPRPDERRLNSANAPFETSPLNRKVGWKSDGCILFPIFRKVKRMYHRHRQR
jgi:hypothetical protein